MIRRENDYDEVNRRVFWNKMENISLKFTVVVFILLFLTIFKQLLTMKAIIAFSALLLMFAFVTPVQADYTENRLETVSVSEHQVFDGFEQQSVIQLTRVDQAPQLYQTYYLSLNSPGEVYTLIHTTFSSSLALKTQQNFLTDARPVETPHHIVNNQKWREEVLFGDLEAGKRFLWFHT